MASIGASAQQALQDTHRTREPPRERLPTAFQFLGSPLRLAQSLIAFGAQFVLLTLELLLLLFPNGRFDHAIHILFAQHLSTTLAELFDEGRIKAIKPGVPERMGRKRSVRWIHNTPRDLGEDEPCFRFMTWRSPAFSEDAR